jgi:hypothetical protein
MASTSTTRILAAAASLPLAFALFSGIAQADNGAFADDGGVSAITGQLGGVGDDNYGNNSQSQQVNNGDGGTNESNSANVQGIGNSVDQSDTTTTVVFSPFW